MRVARQSSTGRRAVKLQAPLVKTTTLQAPVKGWASEDSDMEAEEGTAVILDNFFPEATVCRVRRGYESFATGVGGEIRTLMSYVSGTTQKLFAARSNGAIYDVTSAGVASISYSTDRTLGDYQWTMFGNTGGQFLYAVNGADAPIYFDGSTWTVPTLTGMTPANLIHVMAHKKRLWFIEKNTPKLWYLDTDAVQGELTEFDVSGQLTKGGHLMTMGSWTLDGGAGTDDLFVAISSEGEVVVYTGLDPSSATLWQLQGTYQIGEPIGRKSLYKLGGDLLCISRDGLLPFSIAFITDRAAGPQKAYTKRIRRAYADMVAIGAEEYGWQLEVHPPLQMALLNVPAIAGNPPQQFVFNVTTGAWARWTNHNATCWHHFQNELYFGGSEEIVFKANTGATDNGAAIPAYMLPAFGDLGYPGLNKYITGITPLIVSDVPNDDARPSVVCAVDFTDPNYTNRVAGEVSLGSGIFGVWDVTEWDNCVWFGELTTRKWRVGGNLGKSISVAFSVNVASITSGSNFKYRVRGFDINYQVGNQL